MRLDLPFSRDIFQRWLHKDGLDQGERLGSIPKVMVKWMGRETAVGGGSIYIAIYSKQYPVCSAFPI